MKKEQIPNVLTIGRILFIPLFSQMFAIIFLLLHWNLIGQLLLYIALFFTIYSGYDYFKGSAHVFKGTFGSK